MSITSLATLKTEVIKKANREGNSRFATACDGFVQFVEARLNRALRIRDKVVKTSLTGTTSSRQLTLPSDFREPISLYLTTYGDETELTPFVWGQMELNTYNAPPEAWAISDDYIELDSPCDQAHTFQFYYRAKALDLATTDPNWLLTNHPDVYFNGMMVEAYKDIGGQTGFGQAALWEQIYQASLAEVNWEEARSKSIAPLRVDPALTARGAFNINSGD